MGPNVEWEVGTKDFGDKKAWLNRHFRLSSQHQRTMSHGTYTMCHRRKRIPTVTIVSKSCRYQIQGSMEHDTPFKSHCPLQLCLLCMWKKDVNWRNFDLWEVKCIDLEINCHHIYYHNMNRCFHNNNYLYNQLLYFTPSSKESDSLTRVLITFISFYISTNNMVHQQQRMAM